MWSFDSNQEKKEWFESKERLIWVKKIKLIFHEFDLSHDSSHVIRFKRVYDPITFPKMSSKIRKLNIIRVNLICDSSKASSWFKLGEIVSRFIYLVANSNFDIMFMIWVKQLYDSSHVSRNKIMGNKKVHDLSNEFVGL